VDGISPIGKNGVNDKYPYFMTFYLVNVKDRTTPAIGNFIEYIDSREGENILGMNGHIPIGKEQGKP
jgi:ABC-type phosphate transport system substrate-binding protein